HLHRMIRAALQDAVIDGLLAENPARNLRLTHRYRPRFTPLTADEAKQLLKTARGDRLEALYAVALALGLRRGEALGLRWQDVDLEAGLLHVRMALELVSGRPPRLVEPKTRKSRRTLPLPAAIVSQLRAHRTRQLEERLLAGARWQGARWGLVFTSTIGGPVDARGMAKKFKRHLVAAGLPDIRF